MKMKIKHVLFLGLGAGLCWWLYRKAQQQSSLSSLSGLGESNQLVGQPKVFSRRRMGHSYGSTSVLKTSTPPTPLVELDDLREPAVVNYVVTDAGLGRF